MWFKHGLKAQKLLAQGIALGIKMLFAVRLVRAKALNICCFIINFIVICKKLSDFLANHNSFMRLQI